MKKPIAILMLIVLIPICAMAEADMYCLFGTVVDIEYDTDCVTVDDGDGNLWEYYGVDYVEYGDLVVMLMWDNDTPDWIYDDYVLNAYKCTQGEAEELVLYIKEVIPLETVTI